MKKLYSELLERIEELQPEYYGFEQVIYSAMELLDERKDLNFDEIYSVLYEALCNYRDYEILARVDRQIDEIIKKHPEKEKEFLSEAFILGELKEGDYKRDPYKCCEFLGELNPLDWIEWYQILEDFIEKKYPISDLISMSIMPNVKPYELMAILALNYVKEAIDFNNEDVQLIHYERYSIFKKVGIKEFLYLRKARAVREVISAFISINKARDFKFNVDINKMKEDITKKP